MISGGVIIDAVWCVVCGSVCVVSEEVQISLSCKSMGDLSLFFLGDL